MHHQYAIDAAKLLVQCLEDVDHILSVSPPTSQLYTNLQEALFETESKLQQYFREFLENERLEGDQDVRALIEESHTPIPLSSTVRLLKSIRKQKRRNSRRETGVPTPGSLYDYPLRTTEDSLMFRLITVLQLCRVRLEDARAIRNRLPSNRRTQPFSLSAYLPFASTMATSIMGILTVWAYGASTWRPISPSRQQLVVTKTLSAPAEWTSFAVKVGATGIILSLVRSASNQVWTASKISNSTTAIQEWNEQWSTMVRTRTNTSRLRPTTRDLSDTEQAQLLVEYALREPRKTSLWRSSGELRFFMLKRAMDVFYASVETAMGVTNNCSASDWQLLGATAAAASFYSTPGTGASQRVVAITSSSQAAGDLIRNAWGMVSLPAVKNLSLQASRYIKGAAVADRIEICGVPCFVLSKDPAPELATSIDSFKRMTGKASAPSLATIQEEEEHTTETTCSSKPFARSTSLSRCRQRDVIFHLTGGGFFAHIIASDLLYLLDWSSATGAVVICPEYSLLPDHCFPDALDEITSVYRTLVSGEAALQLGFEVNRIVVTGESAGGNLASALCIQLARQGIDYNDTSRQSLGYLNDEHRDASKQLTDAYGLVRFPDALMLSCPVLDLSAELSPSRVVSTRDPVMPGSIISAISDAYIPSHLGVSRKDPLVSPIFASNEHLRLFPPTLLFASSNDPVLDDSVVFDRRLRSLGVDSELRVADHLPHAYLGLGTTGFPEAVQVQKDCQRWLVYQLTRNQQPLALDEDSSSSW